MNLELIDKVALVLASSKGLGFACAFGLYEEGANVVLCSRSEENLKIAKGKIESLDSKNSNNKVFTVVTDLRYDNQIESLVEKTLEEFGRIDILVHNAGGPPSGPIDKITKDDWKTSIDLNLLWSSVVLSSIGITGLIYLLKRKSDHKKH